MICEEEYRESKVIFVADDTDYVDYLAEEVLKNITEHHLCKGCMSEKQGEICYEVSLEGKSTLTELYEDGIDKTVLLNLLKCINEILTVLRDSKINHNLLLTEIEYIYFDEETSQPFLVCMPIVKNKETRNEVAIIRDVMSQLTYKIEDSKYVIRVLNYLNNAEVFNIEEIQQIVVTEPVQRNIEQQQNTETKQNTEVQDIETEQQDPMAEEPRVKQYEDVMSYVGQQQGIAQPKENNRNVDFYISAPKAAETVVIQQPVQKEVEYVDATVWNSESIGETTVLGQGMIQATPHFIREKNSEKVSINKWLFIIGKEVSSCDYAIRDNTNVSRNHVKIIVRGSQCFVVDDKSTNRTYINGEIVQHGVETEIQHGARLRLADEVFVFYKK